MKKTILFTLALFLTIFSYSKTIVIHKKGGKPCKDKPADVCYREVDVEDSERRYEQSCKGRGLNSCPKVGIVTVGSIAFDVDNFVVNVENAILAGSTSANGVITDTNGAVVAHYTWTGTVNIDGNLEYDIIIDDEV